MRWIHTIKFKIVALAVVTGVLSAVVTAQLLLGTTRADITTLLLESDANSLQGTAALLGSKIDILQTALQAVARTTEPAIWQDHAALERHLQQESAANALFDVVLASDAQGQILVRLVEGKPSADLPNIADRPYFQNAITSDQLVISEPLIGRASKIPLVILARAAPRQDGRPTGVIAGSLALGSAGLFSNIGQGNLRQGSRTLVVRSINTVTK